MPPSLVGLALDALVEAGRLAEVRAALDLVPSLAAVRGKNGALLLHNVAGSDHWDEWAYDKEHGLTRWSIINDVYSANTDALCARDDDGMMPIHHAATRGSLLATQFLIEQSGKTREPRPERVRDTAGMLPIHLALESGAAAEVFFELYWAGADRCAASDEEKDGYGWELLHLACAFGASSRVVGELLSGERWESAFAPLEPQTHAFCSCRRCEGVQAMPRVAAADADLPHDHPAYGRAPRHHPRLEGSLHSLPVHIAARCGAKRSVIAALARECEGVPNCALLPHGHVIDGYGYLPSDYAIAQGASPDVVDELFRFEARVIRERAHDPPVLGELGDAMRAMHELDARRRQLHAMHEPERRRRRRAEPGGSRSTKRPRMRMHMLG